MAVNPPAPGTLDFQAFYFPPGAAIKFPLIAQIAPFTPNAISINNRTALNLQFGPTSQGPFIPAGSYTLNIYPWTYGPSLFVTSLGGSLQATDFLDVHFLSVNTPGGVGVPQITASAPAGWGPVGPGNTLANVNAGDPFNFGQVQQLINLLTGVMTGQKVVIAQAVESTGGPAGFQFDDRDGIGGDQFTWFANAGSAFLFSSVLGASGVRMDEAGNWVGIARFTTPATGASNKPLNNLFPITPVQHTISGTGDIGITAFTVTGISSAAVMVSLRVQWQCNTVGAFLSLFDGANNLVLVATALSAAAQEYGLLCPVTTGVSNQMQYSITNSAGAATTFRYTPLGEVQPS